MSCNALPNNKIYQLYDEMFYVGDEMRLITEG